jgi:hypothetical protein
MEYQPGTRMLLSKSASAVAERPAEYRPGDDHVPMSEQALARLWQKRAARQRWFRTDRGVRVRVLYPGRPGKAAGPDFRNALLEFEGVGLVQGDVEIHLRQRDWDAHGHHDDPNYNGVVLHAALQTDGSATSVPSGQPVPVILLGQLLQEDDLPTGCPDSRLWALLTPLGFPRPASEGEMGALLDRAGDARFMGRSSWYGKLLAEQDPDQTLYEGLLEALGYRHNQQPFLTLAGRAPYRALERALKGVATEERAGTVQAWLLKLSGLLPDQESGGIILPRVGFGRAMSGREWHCFRVRPANHPRRRIAGASILVARFLDNGLVSSLTALAAAERPKDLTSALIVGSEPEGGPAYIGQDRARDLAVNVVLPLAHARAVSQDNTQRAHQCLGLYHRWGKLQENEITSEMAARLLHPSWSKVVSTARRQQGLLHLQQLLAGAG